MNEKVEKAKVESEKKGKKIRKHFKNNKVVYLVGLGCTTLGALSTLAVVSSPLVSNRLIQVLTYKSSQTLEVWIEALGDPGNVIQDMTSGIIYASQGQAARELGLNPADISRHLAGHNDAVKGHIFTKLGKAMVAE